MTRLWCWLFDHRWIDHTTPGFEWFPAEVRYCSRCHRLEIEGVRQ